MTNPTDEFLWTEIRRSRATRLKLATESHYWFSHIYFGENVRHPTADFQKEIYALTEDPALKHVVIVAFRGSGKSTIATLSCPIWSILGAPKKKFVLILSQTQPLAKTHLQNIKRAFELNELLRNDFGPVEELSDEWGSMSLVLPKYGARITAASVDQSIRGIRHGAYRPDLIIADDVEDMASTKTREGREQTYQWFVSEVIPAGDQETKLINIGNLLHEDSLLMRLKVQIDEGELDGVYREYPIVRDGQPLWPGKYPDERALDEQRRKVVDSRSWLREYMLQIVPDTTQVIRPEWIHYYDTLPAQTGSQEYLNSFIGVDLAISEKQSADNTALVVIHAYGYESTERRYYLDPVFVNRKLTFLQTAEMVEQLYRGMRHDEQSSVIVEDVGYQSALVEILKARQLPAYAAKIRGDKHARLTAASLLFEQGRVLFPADGQCRPITEQLVGFGVEKHDDLVDALTLALNYVQTAIECTTFAFSLDGPEVQEFRGIRYKSL